MPGLTRRGSLNGETEINVRKAVGNMMNWIASRRIRVTRRRPLGIVAAVVGLALIMAGT